MQQLVHLCWLKCASNQNVLAMSFPNCKHRTSFGQSGYYQTPGTSSLISGKWNDHHRNMNDNKRGHLIGWLKMSSCNRQDKKDLWVLHLGIFIELFKSCVNFSLSFHSRSLLYYQCNHCNPRRMPFLLALSQRKGVEINLLLSIPLQWVSILIPDCTNAAKDCPSPSINIDLVKILAICEI